MEEDLLTLLPAESLGMVREDDPSPRGRENAGTAQPGQRGAFAGPAVGELVLGIIEQQVAATGAKGQG